MRRGLRWAVLVLSALGLAGAGAAVWSHARLVASLPQLDGLRSLPGLSSPIRVERDARGVPTLRGASRADLSRALGFVHAQERFFQMDLLRRRAAGELAELFGRAAVEADREIRIHRFRRVAGKVIARAAPDERAVIEAYAEGVNAGLGALGAHPFEYALLRTDPLPWKSEDTVLVVLAMFVTLQDEKGRRESTLGVMADTLPPALFEFLASAGTDWDAPIVGEAFEQPAVPGPEIFDMRAQGAHPIHLAARGEGSSATFSSFGREGWGEGVAVGSNNWAVAGAHSGHGGALVANDMHLEVAVPNTWYRASLVWQEGGEELRMTGVTLPGTPAVVVGSNGHVAWGFTNSYGDWGDLVVLEPAPGVPDAYLTPEGPRRFERADETIRVKGGPDESLQVAGTVWGPVVDRDHRGRQRALRWVAHEPEAVNLKMLRVESARSLDEALTLANGSGTPAQNFVCADRSGRIGWTIMGTIPRRVGFDGRLPGSWADGSRRWDGWLAPSEYPRVVDPPGGRIWTANARVVDGGMLARLGDGGYDLGARARQIRDDLRAVEKASERDMLAVQLDDRALFLARWQELLLRSLTAEAIAKDARRAEARRFVDGWGAHAAIDSVGYRLVRAFRLRVRDQVFAPLTGACRRADPGFEYRRAGFQWEGPLWALLSQRPMRLLDPRFSSWDELLLSALDAVLDDLLKHGGPLAQRTWGERNSPVVGHPLSGAVPFLGRWLDMPRVPIAGDFNMPRAQDGGEGASERFAVSPGRETEGYFHMPCGQSGHPLSPHYGDGHDEWLRGTPAPFLPGPSSHTLTLTPES